MGWPSLMKQSADGWWVRSSALGLQNSRLLKAMSESAPTVLIFRLFHSGIVRITVAFPNWECLSLAETLFSFHGCPPSRPHTTPTIHLQPRPTTQKATILIETQIPPYPQGTKVPLPPGLPPPKTKETTENRDNHKIIQPLGSSEQPCQNK